MDKRILKRLLNERVFVFLGIVALVVVGIFWRKEIFLLGEQAWEFLISRKDILLSGISLHFKEPLEITEELEEPLEITLPEIEEEEPVLEEEILAETPRVEEEPSLEEQPSFAKATEGKEGKCQMSLSDIEEQVEDISGKIEAISQQVGELVQARQARELKLAEIEEQISDVSAKVGVISQAVAELAESSA